MLSTHSFSTHPTSQGNPPRAVLAAATEEPTADLAYKRLLSDLKSLPTRRASKWGSTTSNNVKNYSEGLMQSLETCPALKDLYYLNEDSSSYCKELIQVVGPISRYQLMDMIVKHPQLMVKALTSENLRVCSTPIMMCSFSFYDIKITLVMICSQHMSKFNKI